MGKKSIIGLVMLIVGILISLLSIAADSLGIGGASGFGYKQTTGAIVGIVMVIGGLILYRAQPSAE